jgi:hypothetical protein
MHEEAGRVQSAAALQHFPDQGGGRKVKDFLVAQAQHLFAPEE